MQKVISERPAPSLIRIRRSALYMPASNRRALEKARELPADVLLLDLEDAVALDAKELAREQVATLLAEGGYGKRELIVRVNGLDTPWGEADLAAVATLPVDGVLLPKVDSLELLNRVVQRLNDHGADPGLPLWIMIETPLGVLRLPEIAAHQRVAVLVMGTNDLAKEMRIAQTPAREGLLHALSSGVMAARAFGRDVLDGVYNQLDDDAGFQFACEQGKLLGFDGKTLIHPRQVSVCNDVFSPSLQDIEAAREMLTAWKNAHKQGKGVLVHKGRLVEQLHIREAERLLAFAGQLPAD